MYLEKLQEMFLQMVLRKDISLISLYYHQDFLLYANNLVQNYSDFLMAHQTYYADQRQYSIEYDKNTLLEQGERVDGRVWITVTMPQQEPRKMEVILIVQYKDGKIYRLWELTFPDWSKLPEFEKMT